MSRGGRRRRSGGVSATKISRVSFEVVGMRVTYVTDTVPIPTCSGKPGINKRGFPELDTLPCEGCVLPSWNRPESSGKRVPVQHNAPKSAPEYTYTEHRLLRYGMGWWDRMVCVCVVWVCVCGTGTATGAWRGRTANSRLSATSTASYSNRTPRSAPQQPQPATASEQPYAASHRPVAYGTSS